MGYKSRAITRLHRSIEERLSVVFGTFRTRSRDHLIVLRVGNGSKFVEFEASLLGRGLYFGRDHS